ncbi:RNA polymerase sigma-70 factor [Bacteroides sp.]|uniref:RNA polymerase sigma-70 factor n=1 Tax=Bacteroides sp. TaxID=29523 RepID=UPI002FC6968F
MRISFTSTNKEKDFKKLYEEYYAPFCLYAKRFIDDSSTREDIVSDVFASLWDKEDSFELNKTTALGYLKTCVRNSCLNYLKHLEYEWSYAELCQKRDPIYATAPDSIYTLDELYKMLYETLNKLPESYRVVFTKNFFEGKTHAEIAKEMNLSVKSIDRYKQRTMDFLRAELKEYLPLIAWVLLHRNAF